MTWNNCIAIVVSQISEVDETVTVLSLATVRSPFVSESKFGVKVVTFCTIRTFYIYIYICLKIKANSVKIRF